MVNWYAIKANLQTTLLFLGFLVKNLILVALLALPTTFAFAGSCDNSWQTAKDCSSCGDRAADRRPGGR
ncbi:hypothetical protein EXE25_17535 [Acinetobacter bouvetii]|uniref:Uncharacterized protein n=1 Tax=Acinetobacter bouvetii TaxID=202951 RepID=A0A4Q7AM93_9GAMM|nr:hypothetical protein [Acinetobacter bouvetii]RZG64138.1 hypothetical protein EXE25_17535 [Acinetobacter bouvetii]